ncbi:MAG: hypothetical protein PF961_22510, partial [Planctomycetota bacterium]|nr:hypothetical protein [Planctomycetota bacterium]
WWAGAQTFNILPSRDIKVIAQDGTMVHIGPGIGAVDFWPSAMTQQMGIQRPAEGTIDNGYPVIHYPGDLDGWKTWIATRGIPSAWPGAEQIVVEDVVIVPELTQLAQAQLEPIRRQQAQ